MKITFKHFIGTYILFMVLMSCGSNYYLKRSKANLRHAIILGAKVDSIKTEVKATGTISAVSDSGSTKAAIDSTAARLFCIELLKPILSDRDVNVPIDTEKSFTIVKSKAIKGLQKAVCPNDSVSNKFKIQITVGGHKIEIPAIIRAWSKGGKAGYMIDIPKTNFEYVKTDITTNIKPDEKGLKWWQQALIGLGLLVVGFVLGRVVR